jgi:putative DNA primase/helicase
MNAKQIAHALGNACRIGNGWTARCPLATEHQHGDANPSLSISERAGKILVHCQSRHANEQDRVIAALRELGLWQDANEPLNGKRIVATYDYCDELGALLFQVVRYQPKKFLQRRPDGKGGWGWNLNGVRRVLYRLPELFAANRDETVWIVEGEKDADALAALGLVATTNSGGSGKWRGDYNEPLRGWRVAILPDNDQTGENHARVIAASLAGVAESLRIVQLPGLPPKGDVSDWIAAGGTADKLIELADQTPALTVADVPDSTDSPSFGFRTVREYLSERAATAERKSFWAGTLRAGEISMLAGRAMAGKSTFACALTRALHLGVPFLGRDCVKARVGYMALERNGVKVAKLLEEWDLGDAVYFLDQLPSMPLANLAAFIKAEILRHGLEVVIVDHLQNLAKIRDSKDYSLVSLALEPFQKVAKETDAHILLLHHQGKTEREGVIDVMGSEAYRAAVDTLLEAKARKPEYFIRGEIRGEADLPRTQVTINLKTGETESIDAHLAEIDVVGDKIKSWLQTQCEPATEKEIQDALTLKRETTWDALTAGVAGGTFERSGAGKKGDPFRFQLFGFSSQPRAGTAGTESGNRPKPAPDMESFSSRPSGNRKADREPNLGAFEDLE